MLQQSPNQYARRWPSFFLAVLIERLPSTPRYDISLRRNRASNIRWPAVPPRVDRWPMPRLVTAEPSCARCRECGWTRDADDNWSALITPSNARFTDLGMLVSRLTFIQQRSYDRRCRTSHSCQNRTHEPHKPGGGEKPGEASCQPALSQLLTFPFATQMEPPSDAPGHEKCHREENEQR
jgi:hypothetical protein